MKKKDVKPRRRTVKEAGPKYQIDSTSRQQRGSSNKGTANIAIPDSLLKASNELAQRLNISLSELYAAALDAYVAAHQNVDATALLDHVYETEPSTIDPAWVKIQVTSLAGETW
jgi:hypothetical protein